MNNSLTPSPFPFDLCAQASYIRAMLTCDLSGVMVRISYETFFLFFMKPRIVSQEVLQL